MLEHLSPEIRKMLRQIKKQTLALQSIRHLNKIQKLIWFEMATQVTGFDVNRICCNNKPINLTVYNVGDSKSSVLLCATHVKQKYFLKDIFEVKLLDEKLVNSHTL
ncbi:hypothetical protein N9W45_04000 [Nitrosopumilus sp.]|nr:hypothetical protein [Nitrosopumilus sp.]